MQDFASFSFDFSNEIETEIDPVLTPKIDLVKKLLVTSSSNSEGKNQLYELKVMLYETILPLITQFDYSLWDEHTELFQYSLNKIEHHFQHADLANKTQLLLNVKADIEAHVLDNFLKIMTQNEINTNLSNENVLTNLNQHYFFVQNESIYLSNYWHQKIQLSQQELSELYAEDTDTYYQLVSEVFIGSPKWPWENLSLTIAPQNNETQQIQHAQINLVFWDLIQDLDVLLSSQYEQLKANTYIVLVVDKELSVYQKNQIDRTFEKYKSKFVGASLFRQQLDTILARGLLEWIESLDQVNIDISVDELKFQLIALRNRLKHQLEYQQNKIQLYTQICLHDDALSKSELSTSQELLKTNRESFHKQKTLLNELNRSIEEVLSLLDTLLKKVEFDNKDHEQSFAYHKAKMLLENGFYQTALEQFQSLQKQGLDAIWDVITIYVDHFDDLDNVSLNERFEWIQYATQYLPEESYFHYLLGLCYELGQGTSKDLHLAFKSYSLSSKYNPLFAMNKLGECYLYGNGTDENETKAFECFKQSVENDLDAKFNLGRCYLWGWGTDKNEVKAIEYLTQAAEQNQVFAQNLLAECYLRGWGQTQDDRQAFKWYMKSAEQGLASAQYAVGWCYLYGRGTEINDEQAVQWLLKSAEQESSDSQNLLGECFLNGWGVTQDDHQAFQYYLKAAEKNHHGAQNSLGQCYLNGYGTEINHKKAYDSFLCSATQQNAAALNNVGDCYFYGWGVDQSNSDAFIWFKKAADQGYAEAQSNLAYCYQQGVGVEQNLALAYKWYYEAAQQNHVSSQNQLGNFYLKGWGTKENEKLAFEWYQKAAQEGFVDAENNLGRCFSYGWGVTKNLAKAFEWYERAANKGYAGAQYNAGICLLNGAGVKENSSKAYEYFSKAAEQGNSEAQNMLGLCYIHALGTPKDEYQAVHWFDLASKQEHTDAYFNLGCAYLQGIGISINQGKAFKCFNKAAKKGHVEAQYNLAGCYIEGWGTSKDLNLAKKWLSKAADQGHKDAAQHLQSL